MSYTGNNPVTGPALVTYNSKNHQTLDDLQVAIAPVDSPIVTGLDGQIDASVLRHDVRVTYTPDGRWTADMKGVLFPYLSKRRGENCELSGVSDTPLRIDGIDGQIHTVKRAVLTRMPEITFAVDKPVYGPAEWEGICARGKDPKDADSYYTVITTGASVTDANFDPADQLRGNATLTFGSLSGIEAQDGWKVTPALTVQRVIVGGVLRKIVFDSLTATVTGIPASTSADALLTALKFQGGDDVLPGRSGRSISSPLTIAIGNTTVFYAAKAALVTGAVVFGVNTLREGEIAFQIIRDFSSGSPAALWAWTAPSP